MRLRFSRTADYGLRAALAIGTAPPGERVKRQSIARATNAPASVLAQALASMTRAGLLSARSGRNGGYRLARPASEVTIHDIVVAIDDEDAADQCVLRGGSCMWEDVCPFHTFLTDARKSFLDALRATTLADLVAEIKVETLPGDIPKGDRT
jgi:Rrf2 family iron-sulfur cluster assembly transcriptional regulator